MQITGSSDGSISRDADHGVGAVSVNDWYRLRLAGPGSRLDDVFAWLRDMDTRYTTIVEGRRGAAGARLTLERTEGEGFWSLLRVPGEMYVIAADCIYNQPRFDTVAGEGNVEFCVALSGRIHLLMPGGAQVEFRGPGVLVLRQGDGHALRQQLDPNLRTSFVSVHCRPGFLRELTEESAARRAADVLEPMDGAGLSYHVMGLTPGMAACVRSIQQSALGGRLRLAHDEAKSIELLCLILDELTRQTPAARKTGRYAAGTARLDQAQILLQTRLTPIPSVKQIARAVGMSESKLKHDFKQRFGRTLFEYGLDRRMLTAMDLLKSTDLPVGDIAARVGYRHHTSFTMAFKRYFGLPPKAASRS